MIKINKMKGKFTISMLIAGLSFLSSAAQTPAAWTLQQCINYAIAHNVTVRQSAVAASQSELEVNTNKWTRLPNLSGSASQNWSWGRAASPVDNSYSNTNSSNTSFSLSSSVPLFTGFRIPNQYELSKLNFKAALADLQKAKDDLSINVASGYLQTLLNKELCKVAEEQVLLSQQQLDRLIRMEQVGKSSQAEVAEARATVEQNKLSAVQSDNNYKLAKLDLSQLLELSTPEGFEIVQPDVDPKFVKLTPPDEIYQVALAQKPGILAAKYRLEGSEKSLKIAKAAYYPELSLGMGLSTNYYTMKGINSSGFGSQLNNNLNKYIGFSLNIPIFDRFSTRNSIRNAKMQQLNYSLQLENTKKTLYKEIQQAWYNALASENQYNSSVSALDAAKASFQLMREKYENGKATAVEYDESQVKLKKADSDLIQAKYDFLFRSKILDFYNGNIIR
jgi:outer membrane protein